MNERELMFFTRQLAATLKAGLPMLQTLDILARGNTWSPPASQLLADMRRGVENGRPLSATLAKYPRQIDALYLHLVRAGEHGGSLESVLERLADYKERMYALKRRIKSAFYAPAFTVAISFIVIAIVLAFHPALNSDAAQAADAPLFTRTLLFFGRHWLLILALPIGAVWGFFKAWKTSPAFRQSFDGILLQTPPFGKLVRMSALARWSRTLATLYAAGVPLIDALERVSDATGNHVYDEASRRIWRAVKDGASLTKAVGASRLFPTATQQMVATGESTGALDTTLNKLAEYYEEEVNNSARALTSLLTPIITVITGIIVGILVIGMHSLSMPDI
ncbi:type II secretion system protein F [Betaproteobacteria bacterium]|nr:type II secretion system protein F [Betaproteobacteria bacterium]GHU46395.1 type II secretion system protein F [Betaproteobacteria bacterium]